jgi:uncharacterized protein (DUF2147 family)
MKLSFHGLSLLSALLLFTLAVVWLLAPNLLLSGWGVEFSEAVGSVGRRAAPLYAGIGIMFLSARNAEPSAASSPTSANCWRLHPSARRIAPALFAVLFSPAAWAGDGSPVGLWKNIDDVSGQPRALIRITESNGALQGKIENLFPGPGDNPNPKCEKCEGASKGAPVIGLVILSGLKKDGDEYAGGQILDPDNGKTYSSKVHLIDGGKKLSVRGYIGVPMLGRTQTWVRQE